MIDVSKVLQATIADARASGNTGMVENLLEADAAIAALFAAAPGSDMNSEMWDALVNCGGNL